MTVLPLHQPARDEMLAACRRSASTLEAAGALMQAWYGTEPARNDFPALPVREGEPVLVLLSLFADAAAPVGRTAEALSPLAPWLAGPAETLRLLPTGRSALHA